MLRTIFLIMKSSDLRKTDLAQLVLLGNSGWKSCKVGRHVDLDCRPMNGKGSATRSRAAVRSERVAEPKIARVAAGKTENGSTIGCDVERIVPTAQTVSGRLRISTRQRSKTATHAAA
jgi:hypothetical protein